VSPGRAWTPGVLIALALAASAYAYVVDRSTISDADRAERVQDVFPSFRVGEVRRVELIQGDGATVLERLPGTAGSGSRWTVTSPLHRSDRAEPGAVDALLRELERAKRVRGVRDSEASGFGTPRVRGFVRVGSIDYEFSLGGDAPRPEGAAYMRIDGEGTCVVDRALKVQLLRGADAYRDRTILPYGAAEVGRLEVASSTSRFVLDREGATFRVEGTKGLRASRDAVERLFASLADARADTFLDDVAAERALAAAPSTVRIVPRDGRDAPIEVELGGSCPGQGDTVVIARQGGDRVSACVPGSVLEGIDVKAAALVDKALFYAHADEIESLQSDPAPGVHIDLARRGSGWHERSPVDRELDAEESEAANALVADLAAARAIDVRSPAPDDHLVPKARLTITRTGVGGDEGLEIAAPGPDGTALARRTEDGAVLRLTADVLQRAEARPFVLRGSSIWPEPFDPSAVTALDSTCGAVRQRLELRDGRWLLRVPAGFGADRAAADAMAEALSRARASRWIAERDDGTFGLTGADACSFTAQLAPSAAGAARTVGVTFGRSIDGGSYAKTADGVGVFVALDSLRSLASRPAIDRDRLRVDPQTVTRVTLLHGAERVTLERRGGGWVRAGSDERAGDELGNGVLAFTAQQAVHPGPPGRTEGFARPTLEIQVFSAAEGAPRSAPTDIVVGAPTHIGALDGYFARVSGVDATFAVARAGVDAILRAL
jgi:hypothetical protein